MRYHFVIVFFTFLMNSYAQTSNFIINSQLEELKIAITAYNYKKIVDFTYPQIYEPFTKVKMQESLSLVYGKMKNEGFEIVDVTFSAPSEIVKNGKEFQFTIDENLFVQTPKGLVLGVYTLIGISNDNGLNWKFIVTSGKSKEEVLKKVTNLSTELVIKPAEKYLINTTTTK